MRLAAGLRPDPLGDKGIGIRGGEGREGREKTIGNRERDEGEGREVGLCEGVGEV